MPSISEVFEQTVIRRDYGMPLVRAVNRFYNEFLTRHDGIVDHAGFFGSGYLGVHTIKWLPSDTRTFWQEVLDGEIEETRPELLALPSLQDFGKVGTDPTNLGIVWLAHKVLANPKLTDKVRRQCAVELISILYFKYITSVMSDYFTYGSDPALAVRCYEAMNYKFDLKVFKTWGRLVNARALGVINPKSIHWGTLQTGLPDEKLVYICTDIKTRCNLQIQAVTALYYKVRAENDRVVSVSAMFDSEDGPEVRDVRRSESGYLRYLTETITDKPSFVRADLVKVVLELNPSANENMIFQTLEWISDTYGSPKGTKLKTFVNEVMRWAFALVRSRGVDYGNLLVVSDTLKGILNSSRNKESDLIQIRKQGEQFVRQATARPNNTVVSGERTAVVMYIVLRSLSESYFSR